MQKAFEALLMLVSGFFGVYSAYTLLRYKIKVHTGERSEYALESSTYKGGLFRGSRTLVGETTEPEEVTYTRTDLIVEAVKSLALIILASWFATRLFG